MSLKDLIQEKGANSTTKISVEVEDSVNKIIVNYQEAFRKAKNRHISKSSVLLAAMESSGAIKLLEEYTKALEELAEKSEE